MTSRFRVQVRKPIHVPGEGASESYVFRDLELSFAPYAGLRIDDFDGERFEIAEIVWSEGQHRFLAYTPPVVLESPNDSVDTALRQYESRGWTRNRRSVERTAA